MSYEVIATVAAEYGPVAGFAVGIVFGLKYLVSVLRTWIEESSRTRRLDRALEGSQSRHRAAIIRACGALEGRSGADPDGGENDV